MNVAAPKAESVVVERNLQRLRQALRTLQRQQPTQTVRLLKVADNATQIALQGLADVVNALARGGRYAPSRRIQVADTATGHAIRQIYRALLELQA